MALSGKFRLRKAMFGKLVLQLEDARKAWPWSSQPTARWRDATPIDLAAPELRDLIDLSNGRLHGRLVGSVHSLPVRSAAIVTGGPQMEGAPAQPPRVPHVAPESEARVTG
jgi:hypothetical protein